MDNGRMRDEIDATATGEDHPSAPSRFAYIGQISTVAAALSAASAVNVLYVALLGRSLDGAALGVFFCAHSILLVAAAPAGAVQTHIAGLHAGGDDARRRRIFHRWAGRLAITGIALVALFSALSPLTASLLRFASPWPAVAAALALGVYAPLPLVYGRLQGLQRFRSLGALYLGEASMRPLAALALIHLSLLGSASAVATLAAGYVAAACAGLLLTGLPRRAEPADDTAPAENGSSLPHTLLALLALAGFAYMDVLFAQRYFGGQGRAPGAFLAGAGAYGAAAFIGRGFVMVTMPMVTVLYPRVSQAASRGEPTWPFLRDAGYMAGAVWAFGFIACAGFADPITLALFPDHPAAADLIRWFPVAMAPNVLLVLLTYYLLGLGKRRVGLLLAGGIALQGAGYVLFHGTPFHILAVLGCAGAVTACAAALYAAAGRHAPGKA